MEKKITKKEMIMAAALTLFAERGYDGVGVDEIAGAVDMKGPALYHYFKGKEALLEGIIETVGAYYDRQFGSAAAIGHLPESMEELAEMSMKRLEFSVHDPQIKKVRRMLCMEQFRNAAIREVTTKHHLLGVEELNCRCFEHLIELGRVKAYDPKLLAFEFTAPISLLVQWIDREPEKEAEVMERIRRHMEHFIEIYGVN